LIPRFGEDRVGEISTPDVQRFILEKLKQGYAWETASHMRHLLMQRVWKEVGL
jgi:hypothetical protein